VVATTLFQQPFVIAIFRNNLGDMMTMKVTRTSVADAGLWSLKHSDGPRFILGSRFKSTLVFNRNRSIRTTSFPELPTSNRRHGSSRSSRKTSEEASASPTTSSSEATSVIVTEKEVSRRLPQFIAGKKPLDVREAMRLVEQGQASLFDVRSPGEFDEDHIPASENVPVLSDDERKTVGTLHKLSTKVEARQVGAALIAKRIASHLDTRFAPSDVERLKIIYCARGGLRSHSLAMILNLIGYDATTIEGGYKSYRSFVKEELESLPTRFKFNVISGLTGTRKTETLLKLGRDHGQQIIDLEQMANHRGSVLGSMSEPQPSQKLFETRIVHTLKSFDPTKPVWIEAESSKVGNLLVPRMLWQCAMLRSNNVYELVASLEDRVNYLLDEYKSWQWQPSQLKEALGTLDVICGKARVADWQRQVDSGDLKGLVTSLLVDHYDVRYRKSKTSQAVHPKAVQVKDLIDEVVLRRSE